MNNLRLARKAAGLKQIEVAEYINLSQSQYSAWENGHCEKMDIKAITKLANRYHVTIDYLLGQDEEIKEPTPEIGSGLNEIEKQIMECVHQMSEQEKEAFLAWLRASKGRD